MKAQKFEIGQSVFFKSGFQQVGGIIRRVRLTIFGNYKYLINYKTRYGNFGRVLYTTNNLTWRRESKIFN